MILSLSKKYSTFCTAFLLMAAALAAPYLLPANPDAALFRSGSLPLILLIMCGFPAKHALENHNSRSLIYGTVLAFIFAICLSIGSELQIYNQLLPGTGSLLRRIAVPCMITPLFSCLFSYLFTWQPQIAFSNKRPIPYSVFFLLISGAYFLVFLALYPGVISYDFQHEIKQFTEGVYSAAHPVFHTLFLGCIYRIGEQLFGSMTHGAALYSIIQFLLLAAIYAWACTFVQRRIPYRSVILTLAVFLAFLPFHGVLAVSTAKDPLFSGLCILLCLFVWEIAEDPHAFPQSRKQILRFVLCCLGMSLLRHNGIFAYFPACVSLLIICRRKQTVAVVCMSLAFSFLIPKGFEFAVGATKIPNSEMMSVPCQQLMRTANYPGLPEEEFQQIERWFPQATHTYRPHCADPAKGGNFNLTRFQQDPYDFWTTYIKYALKYPRIYLEAFLENSIGLWYPDDISHAHSLSNEEWEYIYLNTVYPFAENTYPIDPECKFPVLQKLLYATMHDSLHQLYPILSQLYCPAIYSFLLLLLTLRLCFQRRRNTALCTLPIWGIFISLFFAAGIFIRYTYPIMVSVPLLLALSYFSNSANDSFQ